MSRHGSGVFTENRGQWDPTARFHLGLGGLDVWITDHGVVYDLFRVDEATPRVGIIDALRASTLFGMTAGPAGSTTTHESTLSGHVLRLDFLHTSDRSRAVGADDIGRRSSFFIGDDGSRWGVDCRSFESVRLRGLYDGVDALFSLDGGLPRYDLVVAPGADPSTIRFRIAGADAPCPLPDGRLAITTSLGSVEMRRLYAYQVDDGGVRRRVACAFDVGEDGSVGFALGAYDHARPLVIDPLLYSSYIGTDGNDVAEALAIDGDGAIWVAGGTSAGRSFPITPGAYRSASAGWSEMFVARLDPALSGSAQLTTLLVIGGEQSDQAADIAIGEDGGIWVAGNASSTDIPTTSNAYLPGYKGGQGDMVLLKIDPAADGLDQLAYSSYLGGSAYDVATSLSLDREGRVWVAGYDDKESDMTTTATAFDTSHNGNGDGILIGIDPSVDGPEQTYCATFLGGNSSDILNDVLAADDGTVWVTGSTRESPTTYPTTADAYDATHGTGYLDAVVTRIDPSASGEDQLLYSTLIGGRGEDRGAALAIDSAGNIWVAGNTTDTTPGFPTTPGAYDDAERRSYDDIFVLLLDLSEGTPTLAYSALIGGSRDDRIGGIVVDGRSVWITGRSADFPTTPGAYDETNNASGDDFFPSSDVFLTKLDPTASGNDQLAYSTYIGSGGDDGATDLRLDADGDIWVTGYASHRDTARFPTTPSAYDTLHDNPNASEWGATTTDAFLLHFEGSGISDVPQRGRRFPERLDLSQR